jgi:HK97 family phage portal protein
MSDWLSGGGEPSLKRFVLTESYSRISWVYASVNVIAETIGGTPIQFLRGDINEQQLEIIVDPDDPVNVLFNPPKKPEIPSLRDLTFRTFVHLGIEGGLFWIFGDKSEDGQPTSISTKSIGQLKPVHNDAGELLGWVEIDRRTMQPKQAFNVDEVLAFFYYNPRNPDAPLSPLSAARLSLEAEFYMNGWNAAFFKQGLRSPLAITTKAKLTATQEKEWNKKIKSFYGGIDDAHTALLMSGGADVKELALSTKDLDFVNGKKLNREEITAVYGVPPALVGIFEFANYANSEQQRKIFWQNTIVPRIHMTEELIQVNILDTLFPGTIIRFDLSDIDALQADPVEIASAAKTYFDMGYNRLEIANILDTPELAETIEPEGDEDEPPPEETPEDEDDPNAPPPEETPEGDDDAPVSITPETVGVEGWEIKQANPAQWERYGESHVAMMRNEETKLDKVVRNWFSNVSDAYAKQIRRSGGREAMLDPGLWDDLYRGTVNIQVERLYDLGGQIAAVEIQNGAGGPPLPSFRAAKAVNLADYLDGDELLAFRDSATEFVNKIRLLGGSEVALINGAIPQLIEEGGSIAEIQARIRELIMEERYLGQATTIARTTANAAYNNARATFFSLKNVSRHKWINAGDSNVRNSHDQEGGNEVATGQQFPITLLLYPHDPSGSAAEVINCRCTTIATARGDREQPTQVRTQPDSASARAQAQQSILSAYTSVWKTVQGQSRAVRQPQINSRGLATTHSSRTVPTERLEKLADDLLLDDSFTQIGKAFESGGELPVFADIVERISSPRAFATDRLVKLTAEGKERLAAILVGHLPNRIRAQLPKVKIQIKGGGSNRADYIPSTQTIRMSKDELVDLTEFMNNPVAKMESGELSAPRVLRALQTLQHEYGHHVDYSAPEVREFSRRFFRSRTVEQGEVISFNRNLGKRRVAKESVYEDRAWDTYQLKVYADELPPGIGTSSPQAATVAEGLEVFPMFNQAIGLLPTNPELAALLRNNIEKVRTAYGVEVARPLILDQAGFKEALQFLYGDF